MSHQSISQTRDAVIRRARPHEAQAISDLALRSKGYWPYSPEFLEACRESLTLSPDYIRSHEVFVLEEAGQLAGFYALLPAPSTGEVYLDFLFVAPEAIGQGYGKQLWTHAVSCAQATGFSTLQIVAEPYAVDFYRKMGAVQMGETPSDAVPGRMLPLMVYPLAVGR